MTTPLIWYLLPARSTRLTQLFACVLGVALIAALAQLRFDIGPVPVTGQTLGVLLIAATYGARLGGLTLLSYLAVGSAGLGVFAGGAGGLAVLRGGTAGFLVGFVLAAIVVGALSERGWTKTFTGTVLAMLMGNVIIYVPGLIWLHQFAPDFGTTLAWGLTPFIPGDVIKLLLAAAALPLAWRFFGRSDA